MRHDFSDSLSSRSAGSPGAHTVVPAMGGLPKTAVGPQRNAHPFSLREARVLVAGLSKPNLSIYWADFLTSVTLGWVAFGFAVTAEPLGGLQILFVALAVLALYRAVVFTHELSHIRSRHFRSFRVAWNLLCGFPLMVPAFMYRGVHLEHHRPKLYGTRHDGEYMPFAIGGKRLILLYLFQAVLLPLLVAVRFIIFTPAAWVSPAFRRLIWQRASSLSIDFNYQRPLATMTQDAEWRWEEFGAWLYGVTILALVFSDRLPGTTLAVWYVVMLLILLLNSLRTLVAHRYRNPGDKPLSVPEQFLDSVDIPGNAWITPLWAPVGLRYHATHHLFPGIPYHNLGLAYRRLSIELKDNHLYLKATRRGLWPALGELWRDAGGGGQCGR